MLNVTAKKSHFRGRERRARTTHTFRPLGRWEIQQLRELTGILLCVCAEDTWWWWWGRRWRAFGSRMWNNVIWSMRWDSMMCFTLKWCGVDFLLSGFHSVAVWMSWNCDDVLWVGRDMYERRNIIYHRVFWCVKNAQQHNKWYQQINSINFR